MIGVCIPAHNEENLIAACLKSVFVASKHPALYGETVTVVLVLDSCQDSTASVSTYWPVISLATDARNVGIARSMGAEYLLRQGARWLAFTDADSCVSPCWLVHQLSLKADVVCGTVEVDGWSEHGEYSREARRHFEATYIDRDGHRHVHGANLGISAWQYEQVGGFDARSCGEDQELVDRLVVQGAKVAWSSLPRVITSGRPYSRVEHGFAGAIRKAWDKTTDKSLVFPAKVEKGVSSLTASAIRLESPDAVSVLSPHTLEPISCLQMLA